MQRKVDKFIIAQQLSCGEKIRYMDLVSEIGELGKEIIKSTSYGKDAYQLNEAIFEEIGDCLFSLLALCTELGINANDALDFVLKKYNKRLNQKGSVDSGK